jgi:hypothetical protein
MDINSAAIKKNIRKLRRVVKLAGQVRDFTLLLPILFVLLNNTELNLLASSANHPILHQRRVLNNFSTTVAPG